MLANLTHVVSRVGIQPDWNSLILSHLGRTRCVCLVSRVCKKIKIKSGAGMCACETAFQ
jgi:hypothetical protein